MKSFSSMDEHDKDLHRRFEAVLQQELHELDHMLAQSAADRKPVELDQQSVGRLSRMDAMQVQAMAQESDRRRKMRRHRLLRALERIREGEFGYCTDCGELISDGRLTADPTFHQCVGCARRSD